jgi:aldehyde dehydrogenase (NAD+)
MIEAFEKAGFPKGVVNLVSGKGAQLGDYLATHSGVDMLSFTGSTRVGKLLAQSALGSVKRISLELGGKSPFVWLPGIQDYRPAVRKLYDSIFMNTGQTCTALSRLVVPRSELPAIEAVLVEEAARYTVGDTMDEATLIGPLSSRAQFNKVKEYIELGLQEGARLILGEVPRHCDNGYYVKPTIFYVRLTKCHLFVKPSYAVIHPLSKDSKFFIKALCS